MKTSKNNLVNGDEQKFIKEYLNKIDDYIKFITLI